MVKLKCFLNFKVGIVFRRDICLMEGDLAELPLGYSDVSSAQFKQQKGRKCSVSNCHENGLPRGRNRSCLFGTNHCLHTSTQYNPLSLTRSKCTNHCYRSVAQRKLQTPGDHVKRVQQHRAHSIHALNIAQRFGSRTSGRHLFIKESMISSIRIFEPQSSLYIP